MAYLNAQALGNGLMSLLGGGQERLAIGGGGLIENQKQK